MPSKSCTLIGAPVESGANQRGCVMGPDAYRTAGLAEILQSLGHEVSDLGNAATASDQVLSHSNSAIHDLGATIGWAIALEDAAYNAARQSDMPIFLGGDHTISIGTVPGVARYAAETGREQFVLWLDAHPDLHTLASTKSGNLHGTPVAYFLGLEGFEDYPKLLAPVKASHVCMVGIRSVDVAEKALLAEHQVTVHDMRSIDEHGIVRPMRDFIERVTDAHGALHVSLDVDFLEPDIAPAVGTTVPGGITFREAHLIMEMLHDSGLVTSLDVVELNPFLDDRGRTAKLMVDLCASLMGRKVLDRQTRSY